MKDLLSRIGQWTEKMWRSIPIHLRDAIFTALLLGIAAAICFVLRSIDENGSFTLLIFVLAVVIISRFTEGYFWGVFSSLFGVICVNFVFTYPFSAILENGDTLSTEQQRELLRDVNEDAQWLIRMVENLLSITRISGEQTAISKEYEAAEEILAASVHKFEKRFKSNIRIAVEVPQEVVLVPMDATLIQQVLLNLMENAVLHGESTTELRLSVEHIGDEACFTVSDNGLGIPRERLVTLFDGSLSGEKSGGFDMKKNMGIGLSVCQTIVKAHGGRITAENRPEGGAQFRFYLPLKEEKEDEDQG